ncbi:MAG: hypothetical protein F4Y45_13085 [Acidobacteria bacterium]|nr:hypothetical protein [Acidobacteriota bacterium]MYD70328.1 hypothetical protein [Acidobacteriota bacterium]MYJ04654.1 hypothetical protein [Acidobacteriota bacterium]
MEGAAIDRQHWSGEGDFTGHLLEWLAARTDISFLRVEDSASTRAEVDYNFVSNEIYVGFRMRDRRERRRLLGVIPVSRTVTEPVMTLSQLDDALVADPALPDPDYADEGMIQYLQTERVIPPYQTKGYKLIELVRIYEAGSAPAG